MRRPLDFELRQPRHFRERFPKLARPSGQARNPDFHGVRLIPFIDFLARPAAASDAALGLPQRPDVGQVREAGEDVLIHAQRPLRHDDLHLQRLIRSVVHRDVQLPRWRADA